MEPIRLGIVGPGLIWENRHRPTLTQLQDIYTITAFSATSEASRRKVERDYPDLPFFTDYRELAAWPGIDAIVVLTPIPLNAPVAIAAMRAGKDVFLEKPMARTFEEGREVVRVARETGRRVLILEQSGYRNQATLISRVLQAGEIGDLVIYERVAHSRYDAGRHSVRGYGTTAWRIHPEFPLGTLFDGGHHVLADFSTVFGIPQAVTAYGRQLRPEYGDYDHVLVVMEYANGMRGVLSHSDYMGGTQNHYHIRGSQGLVVVEREQLTIESIEGKRRSVEVPAEDVYVVMWTAMAGALQREEEPPYTLEHGWQELKTLLAIARSIEEGRKVTLEEMQS
jgi:predicted dehydrogenase